jgi:Glycosyl hydrolase family 9
MEQVGDIDFDHEGQPGKPLVPEQFTGLSPPRPVFEINSTHPGADIAAECAGAFASLAEAYTALGSDTNSRVMIQHARQLYSWAAAGPAVLYTSANPIFARTYKTKNPHAHLMLAAAWLKRATGEAKFELDAQNYHANARALSTNPILGWQNPLQEAKVLMMESNVNFIERWMASVTDFIDGQMFASSTDISYSPEGAPSAGSARRGCEAF